MAKPLVLSMGDPAGIGPDIILQSWMLREIWQDVQHDNATGLYVYADPGVLHDRAKSLGLEITFKETDQFSSDLASDCLQVIPLSTKIEAKPAQLRPDHGQVILESIERAVADTLEGKAHGVVTAPIHKDNLYTSGFSFPGHTEYLESLSKSHGLEGRSVMMMASKEMRCVPLTIHVPLARVSKLITKDLILETCRVVAKDLTHQFGVENPRIAVAGLNPHAGENGAMGREEIEVIEPAITQLQDEGLSVMGPFSADTLFHEDKRSGYDVVLAMYHDQALLPVKTVAFHETVNVTLGLPFIRTSPDHGVALDLAGTGKANPSSFIAALKLAFLLNPPHKQAL